MSSNKIPALQEFIRMIQSIPFVSSRHTYKLSEFFLKQEKEEFFNFFKYLCEIREKLELCENCCCWKEKIENCTWCGLNREQDKICVLETWIDAMIFEKSGAFNGIYHILGGTISPIDGITPDLLSFEKLLNKLKKPENKIQEIIIGTNQTPEGDATAFYLEKLLNNKEINIQISYLASGIPVGTSFEFIDKITIGKAYNNRRKN